MTASFKSIASLFVLSAAAAVSATPVFASEAGSAPEIENFVSTTTRAQVQADFVQAVAKHQVARNERDVQRLADAQFQTTKTSAQVRAETREAVRLGLVPHNDADFERIATAEQLRLVELAGLRATETQLASR